MPFEGIILACVVAVLLFALVITLVSRYKKCPSDRVMVIYGKVGSNKDGTSKSARCIHGGAKSVRRHRALGKVHPRRRGLYLACRPVL